MISYAVIKAEDAPKIPLEDIYPKSINHDLHLFLVGVRQIDMQHFGLNKPNHFHISLDVSGDKQKASITDKEKVTQGNTINFNKYNHMTLDIPVCKALAPMLDIQLHEHHLIGSKLAGYTSINMGDLLEEFYKKNNIPLAKPSSTEVPPVDKPNEAPKDKDNKDNKDNKDIKDKKDQKDEKKKSELPKEKDIISNKGLGLNIDSNTHTVTKQINTFKVEENIVLDESKLDHDDDIDADEIDLDNNANLEKGIIDDSKKKTGHKAGKGFFGKVVAKFSGEAEIVYEEFDTKDGEDLDVTPAWLQGRDILGDELEDFLEKKKAGSHIGIQTYPIKTGSKRSKSKLADDVDDYPEPIKNIGYAKMIFLEGDKTQIQSQIDQYKKLMQPKKQILRVYVLDAIELSDDKDPSSKPSTYLGVRVGETEFKDKKRTLKAETAEPEYYVTYDFPVECPGSPYLRVEVWQHSEVLNDNVLCYTEVDLEERYFDQSWQKMPVKPIEYRTLRRPLDNNPCGRLSMWVELINPDTKVPRFDIAPIEKIEAELRVIIWEAKGFEFAEKWAETSDLFIRGKIANQSDWQETDTHWRARAKATFNWRWKFTMKLPVTARDYKGDILQLQLWDRDLVASNTMLAETEINLNQHKLLDKVYKRRIPVKMRKRVFDKKENKMVETEIFWLDVFENPNEPDPKKRISKGKVLVSIELLPKEDAEKQANAMGRDAPNNFPALPEPTGRFSFDILSPLKTLKELVGEKAYRRICCCFFTLICCIIIIAVGYFIGTSTVGSLLAKV